MYEYIRFFDEGLHPTTYHIVMKLISPRLCRTMINANFHTGLSGTSSIPYTTICYGQLQCKISLPHVRTRSTLPPIPSLLDFFFFILSLGIFSVF
jgi:hypothetical protein